MHVAHEGLLLPGFLMGFAHGFGGGSGFSLFEDASGGVAAVGRDFGRKGTATCLDIIGIRVDGGGVVGLDAHAGGGGDGVLVCTQEQEFPLVFLGLVGDSLVDVGHGKLVGRIFLAVGEDRDDDLGWALGVGSGGEFAADEVDGAADGVEQGCAAPGLVGFGGERLGILDRHAAVDGQIFVVEEDQGEGGRDRLAAIVHGGFLGAEEFIEAGDGSMGHGLHGARTVEDECDFCFHGVLSGRRSEGLKV